MQVICVGIQETAKEASMNEDKTNFGLQKLVEELVLLVVVLQS